MREIGILLKETRESRGVEVNKAAKELKIRPNYIEAMESGDVESISNEVYLPGCLKSYANWLGLDGNNLVAKLKSETANLNVANKKVSAEASNFFSLEEDLVKPGRGAVIAIVVVVLAAYLIWSKVGHFDSKKSLEGAQAVRNDDVVGLAYLGDEDKKLFLMASEDVVLKILDSKGVSSDTALHAGEIFFIPTGEDAMITADKPAAVDVYVDDKAGTFLGNLETVSEDN